MIYLDNNATTRPAPEVGAAMLDALGEGWANPSSVHRAGHDARHRVELAREQVSGLIGCLPREIVFTSGGTESTNLAIGGSLLAQTGRTLIITDRLEHSATRDLAEALSQRGVEVAWLPVHSSGLVDVAALAAILASRANDAAIVSVQWANNETGVIQPVRRIGELCRDAGVRFHCDGTQWVGKMPTDCGSMPIDLMTFSAHKFHGPKGAGALYIRRGLRIAALNVGGPQERERRGGTENVPGIVGMGVAADLASTWLAQFGDEGPAGTMSTLRDRFEQAILAGVPDAAVNGAGVDRIWNTSNVAFPRLEAEAILLALSERGLCASAGAACSSGSLDPSPVLLAMGVPPHLAHGSIRFSTSRETTVEEIDRAVEVIGTTIARLRETFAAV